MLLIFPELLCIIIYLLREKRGLMLRACLPFSCGKSELKRNSVKEINSVLMCERTGRNQKPRLGSRF
jgi:hypothetical protein